MSSTPSGHVSSEINKEDGIRCKTMGGPGLQTAEATPAQPQHRSVTAGIVHYCTWQKRELAMEAR
jgi:hypothetical protein